jgi:hypothetical protein
MNQDADFVLRAWSVKCPAVESFLWLSYFLRSQSVFTQKGRRISKIDYRFTYSSKRTLLQSYNYLQSSTFPSLSIAQNPIETDEDSEDEEPYEYSPTIEYDDIPQSILPHYATKTLGSLPFNDFICFWERNTVRDQGLYWNYSTWPSTNFLPLPLGVLFILGGVCVLSFRIEHLAGGTTRSLGILLASQYR